MDVEVRAATAVELDEVVQTSATSWGHHADQDELDDARTLAELDRTMVAFERGRPVGVAAAVSMELTVPGGATLPAAAFTDIGVVPTHRRRGLLRALMAAQLAESRARAEPVSMLVASEGAIYRRFGYGPAVLSAAGEIDARRAGFDGPVEAPGELRLVSPAQAAALMPAVYEAYRRGQPGEVSRNAAYWEVARRDRERRRDGAGASFVVAHHDPGGVADGYAAYRVQAGWSGGRPDFTVDLDEMVATAPPARAALWRYLLGVDLIERVNFWSLPVDEPLRWLLADPRALRVTGLRDLLWVRLIDVPAALSARRYPVAGCIALGVETTDGDSPSPGAGRFLLEGSPQGATCRPCPERTPDLEVALADLGAVYLGGVRLGALARAGRVVEHAPGAVARADALFSSDPAPHCQTEF